MFWFIFSSEKENKLIELEKLKKENYWRNRQKIYFYLNEWSISDYTWEIINKKTVIKDRIESFDDYYPCMQQKGECNLLHVNNWIQFFVSMYNNITINNYDFGLNEVNIILNK